MRILMTGGGTGGHINPALAIAKYIVKMNPDAKIAFAGAKRGMEEKLVPAEGFDLYTVDISGFKRSFKPAAMAHNISAAWRLMTTEGKAKKIVENFDPDIVVGTGGYACYPYIKAAHNLGIPALLHESNALPGKAVMAAGKYSEKILLGFPEAKDKIGSELAGKCIVTGNPIRSGMTAINKNEAKKSLYGDLKPLVVSFWGSLGAREMNKKIAEFIALEANDRPGFRHVHATGSYGWKWMPDYVKNLGVDTETAADTDIREYIDNMSELMAAADLIICRAGAMTTVELCATGTPSLMVPSPNVADNHQEHNARAMEARGAAIVIPEHECSGTLLYTKVKELLGNPGLLEKMSQCALESAITDADSRIYDEIIKILKTKKNI